MSSTVYSKGPSRWTHFTPYIWQSAPYRQPERICTTVAKYVIMVKAGEKSSAFTKAPQKKENMKINPSTLRKMRKDLKLDDENVLNMDRIIRDVTSIVTLVNSPNAGKSRLSKAVTLISVSISVSSSLKTVYDYVKGISASKEYVVKVSERDALFRVAEKWLMDDLPPESKLSVYATSTSDSSGTPLADWEEELGGNPVAAAPMNVALTYDGSIEHQIEIAGHRVMVSTSRPEADAKESSGGRKSQYSDRTITFTCPSHAARDAVLDYLSRKTALLGKEAPGFHTARWGTFVRTSDLAERPTDSVILKPGQMEQILEHLNRFRDNAVAYKKIGVPHRTGIMLYGPPGTGKSSTAAAIANAMHMDLYYLSLKGMDDESLASMGNRIPPNSIVLLEDVDVCTSVARDREETTNDTEAVSMSALLNLLDGLQSPPGVAFIMTTNRLDVLDEAVLRPGRVDLAVELGYVNDAQLRDMVQYYVGSVPEDLPHVTEDAKLTSAEVVQVIRNHIPTIENAGPDAVKLVEDKLLTQITL